MDFMNSLNRLPLVRRRFEPVAHVNALDHKHVSFKLNFSGGLRSQLVVASVDVGASSAPPKVPVSQPAATATT